MSDGSLLISFVIRISQYALDYIRKLTESAENPIKGRQNL